MPSAGIKKDWGNARTTLTVRFYHGPWNPAASVPDSQLGSTGWERITRAKEAGSSQD
jgi:hypothetical protein